MLTVAPQAAFCTSLKPLVSSKVYIQRELQGSKGCQQETQNSELQACDGTDPRLHGQLAKILWPLLFGLEHFKHFP